MEYHQITINEYLDLKRKIADKLNNMANDYITIGYYLKRIRDTEAYKQDGYASLAEFAQKEYGFSEAATSRAIAVNTKFSVDGNTPLLLENYKGFGSSKLSEMLTLSDDDIKLIKETTTVATIREIKKFNKESEEYQSQVKSTKNDNMAAVEEVEEGEEEKNEVKTEQSRVNTQPCEDLHKVIIEFFRNEKELLDNVWEQKSEEDIVEIINPSGNRTYKKGLYMLFLYDFKEGVALKKFGKPEPTHISWHDFIAKIVEVYKDVYIAGKSIHEAFYGKVENEQPKVEQSQVKSTKTGILSQNEENTQEKTVERNVEKEKVEDTQSRVKSTKTEHMAAVVELSEAAGPETQKVDVLDTPKIAMSQVNTQLCEDLEVEKVEAEIVTEIKHIKVFKESGTITCQENGLTIATENCIDDIIGIIESEISRQVADNMVCEITFRRE